MIKTYLNFAKIIKIIYLFYLFYQNYFICFDGEIESDLAEKKDVFIWKELELFLFNYKFLKDKD